VEARNTKRRSERKSKRTPSQLARTGKANPKRKPGACYRADSYSRAVARACEKVGVKFEPYSLRHGRKMDVERQSGSEAARALLGQKSIETTTHYGKLDVAHAAEVAKKLG
jgi:site-specific recombinase XerC